mgnify:CR=1 FL=1
MALGAFLSTHLLLIKYFLFFGILSINLCYGQQVWAQRKSYRKATEDKDLVKNKLFPKKNRIEIGVPDVGVILNQSYISSIVFHANLNYYWKEDWGFSLEALSSTNTDKSERYCIEHFYNDFKNRVGSPCPAINQDPDEPLYSSPNTTYQGANFGPAYVPIREIDSILTAVAVWTPIYGKQLAFLTNTIYFDIFLSFGGGLLSSTYYPQQTQLKNGNFSRTPIPTNEDIGDDCLSNVGVCPDSNGNYLNYIGKKGRPEPVTESHPTFTFGVGQKVHFLKRFQIKAEFRNYTVLGTEAGFETFFMFWTGFGLRI